MLDNLSILDDNSSTVSLQGPRKSCEKCYHEILNLVDGAKLFLLHPQEIQMKAYLKMKKIKNR